MQISPAPAHPTSATISTLELLTLPIAPGPVTIARKVTEGYFVTLSNLSSGTFSFAFLIVIPTFSNANQCDSWEDRELTVSAAQGGSQVDPSGINNHQSIYDITGGSLANFCQTDFGELKFLAPTPGGGAKVFLSSAYKIGAAQTALWTLLPNLDPSPNGPRLIQKGQFEVRGYATLGIYEAKTKKSKVLLNPEARATYYPKSLNTALDPVSPDALSQTATVIESAAGRAFHELQAASGQNISFTESVKAWIEQNGLDAAELTPFASDLAHII
ncbi:MAG: hypothetical protein GC161_15825 [Planctomycetaceae bacterium]|nr:hypothetical protein [Planctomycetaceae bacterium]